MLQRARSHSLYTLLSIVLYTLLAAATVISLRVATTTAFDVHPDESSHADAFCYYESEWWPPELNADGLRYNPWGLSRLHEEEIAYVVYGKAAAVLRPFTEAWFKPASPTLADYSRLTYLPLLKGYLYCSVAYHTYRLINVTAFVVTMVVFFLAGRRYRWSQSLALLTLSIPMVVYVYSYGNSDGWSFTTSTFLLLFALRFHDRGSFTWRSALWLGLLTGLVLLSKRPFWLSIPLSYTILTHKAFLLWQGERAIMRQLAWPWLPIVLITTALLILPQKIIYPLSQGNYAERVIEMREERARADLRPSSTEDRNYLLRDKGFPFSRIWKDPVWWRLTYQSFYGYFGYWQIQSPWLAYLLAPILLLTAIACTYLDFWRRRPAYGALERILLVLNPLLCLALIGSSLYYSWIFDAQPQGRFLLPMLMPLSLLVGGAVNDEPRWLRRTRTIIWGLLLLLSVYTLWGLFWNAPSMSV